MNDATNNGFSSDPVSNSDVYDNLRSQEQSSTPSATPETPVETDKTIKTSDSIQNIDWQQLAHKLREHNRKLLKKVFNLEQSLIDATNQVQEHQEIARQEELTITEQAEKLTHSQEEIADLLQQLEKERQEIKSQQILVKNLSLQLKASRQQAAKLERECAVIQENYNQKNHELLSLVAQKEELESRLYRQQQQTLQYKAALEKYSATEQPVEKLPSLKILSQLKHQPIQPWSDNSEKLALNNVLPTVANEDTENQRVTQSSNPKSLEKPQQSDWQVPEIEQVTPEKQIKSLSAVKLPKFQKINHGLS